MSKPYNKAKFNKIKIKYSLIIFALAFFLFSIYKLMPTFMRYYFNVTAEAIGYAKETRTASYIVKFHANTGIGSMSDQPIPYDTPTNLNQNTFTKTGYSFLEWNTQPDGSGTSYLDGEQINISSLSTIDLYAQWIEGVAIIVGESTGYNSLQAAINAVHTDNIQKTVRLLADVNENLTIAKNQNIVFDLQNKTISITTGSIIVNEGTIRITNGTLTSSSTTDGAINNLSTGNITISGGSVIMTSTKGKQALYNNNGIAEITGNAYLSAASSQAAAGNKVRATVQNLESGTLNITGGTIVSLNFQGVSNAGTMTIGTKDGNVNKTAPTIQGSTLGVNSTVNFNFYDGIIKGKTNAFNDETYILDKETGFEVAHSEDIIDNQTYKTAYLAIINTVTFNANGGTVSEATRTVENGEAIKTLPIPTRTNYIFDGWYTLAEVGSEITENTIINSDIEFFAHWREECTVTFTTDGGTISEGSRIVGKGLEIGTLPTADRTGYIFEGWYTLAEGGSEITENTIINSDIEFFAHWIKICRVTFTSDGGTVSENTRTVLQGLEVGTLPTAYKTGYIFEGWYTLATGGTQISENTIINNDIEFFAHWTKVKVAEIDGGAKYDSLQEAVDNVTANNIETTITLLVNTTENITVARNKNIVFDLQSYTLSNDGDNAAITNNGKLKIISGTIQTNGESNASINNNQNGNLTLTGGRIISTSTRSAVYNDKGTVLITGSAYIEATPSGIPTTSTLTRGTVHNLPSGNVTITGGTIVAHNQQAVSNQGTLVIGIKDGNINTSSPIIIGKEYGIKSTGSFKFYDGIIKGITDAIDGTVLEEETNSQEVDSTEVIDGETYKTKYLELIP